MTTQDIIVETARQAHRKHWSAKADVSEQTKASTLVCQVWQAAARGVLGEHLLAEHPVAEGLGERIDLVDTEEAIAYELKVSQNNTHFEFYRDIFKVAVHNERSRSLRSKKLVFITPSEGARKLGSG